MYKKDKKYNEIVTILKKMKPKILNIHIPGTGGHKNDGFPTYVTFEVLQARKKIALIALEAVGSNEDIERGYIPPAVCNTSFLDPRKLRLKERIFDFFRETANSFKGTYDFSKNPNKAINNLESSNLLEPIVPMSKITTKLGGLAFGCGDDANVEIIMNTLMKLKEDKVLPDRIILAGHSRGAINAIKMSNHIFHSFPKIKIHMVFTDPVPGPFKESWLNKTIPASVETLLIFYAAKEDGLFLTANHISKLRFMSDKTVVTSYSVGDNHKGIIGNKMVTLSVCLMIARLNGHKDLRLPLTKNKTLRHQMKSENSNRLDHNYLCITKITDSLDKLFKEAIQQIRTAMDKEYISKGDLKCFVYTKNPLPFILGKLKNIIDKGLKCIKPIDCYLNKEKLTEIFELADKLKVDVEYYNSNGKLNDKFLDRFNLFNNIYKKLSKKKKNMATLNVTNLFSLKLFKNNLHQKYDDLYKCMGRILLLAHVQKMVDMEFKLRTLITGAAKSIMNSSLSSKERQAFNDNLSELVMILNTYMEKAYKIYNLKVMNDPVNIANEDDRKEATDEMNDWIKYDCNILLMLGEDKKWTLYSKGLKKIVSENSPLAEYLKEKEEKTLYKDSDSIVKVVADDIHSEEDFYYQLLNQSIDDLELFPAENLVEQYKRFYSELFQWKSNFCQTKVDMKGLKKLNEYVTSLCKEHPQKTINQEQTEILRLLKF